MRCLPLLFLISISTISCYRIDNKPVKSKSDYEIYLKKIIKETDSIQLTIEKIEYIRNEIAQKIRIGAGGNDISVFYSKWTDFSGKKFYDVLSSSNVTVQCGATSYFLRNVYRDLGYESHIYDMGCPGIYTHQVTMVKNPDNQLYYVEDAYHNVSYRDSNNKVISFKKMIDLLLKKQIQKITIQYDETPIQFDTTGLSYQKSRFKIDSTIDLNSIFIINRKEMIIQSQNLLNRNNICLDSLNHEHESIYLFLHPIDNESKKLLREVSFPKKRNV